MNELAATRKKSVADSLKELDEPNRRSDRVSLQERIEQAGLTMPAKTFMMVSAGLGGFALLATFLVVGEPIAAVLVAAIVGLGLPNWVLSFLRNRRIKRFIDEFPNAIDIIVRGIKSGLPVGDCLRIIASEAREPLKSEFRAIIEAQSLGLSVTDAVGRLAKRMPIQEANFFVIVVQIQQKAGGNLSEALGNLSRVLRERKKMKAKVSAMSMEAKASAVIIGSLPFIVAFMVQIASPGFITPLFTTQSGHMMLLARLLDDVRHHHDEVDDQLRDLEGGRDVRGDRRPALESRLRRDGAHRRRGCSCGHHRGAALPREGRTVAAHEGRRRRARPDPRP